MQRMKLFPCLMLAGCLFSIAALAGPAKVTLIDESSSTFLTDEVRVRPAGDTAEGRLELLGVQVALPRDSYALSVGRRVAVVTRTPQETSVRLLEADGSTVRQTTVAPDRKVLPFGEAVAAYQPSLHEPGVPYRVDILSSGGTTSIERANRLINDIYALEDYLVISSADADARTVETSVIDDSGQIRWGFNRSGPAFPRVAVRGARAAAVYPGRPESVVELSNRDTGELARLAVPGVMTSVAFLSDGSAILVWGNHTTTLLDVDAQRILWQTNLPASGKPYPTQLAGATSLATPVGGVVAMIARERAAGDTWDVNLVLFDLGDGSIVEERNLYRDAMPPASVRRFPEGAKERLVLPHRVYEVEAQQ